MAPTRDYYADLELPQSADIQEIRKQFRKLALRYHPDRNPGREQDVNSQFQIIQAAHEVLSDPQQKAKYDITLSRSTTSRFAPASGTASGVRGNPWQNVGQQFPTPPRRNPHPTQHPPSGAKRWHDRFSYGVPPTAKQKASAEPSTKASAAYAFESMRGGGYQQAGYKTGQRQERPVPSPPSPTPQPSRPRPPPPPPPPRTESAKKRAEAAFGTRKTGYYPHSGAGDEPPVANHNYSTRINTERPVPIPDPLSQFRDKDEADDEEDEGGDEEEEDFQDSRQRTPYTSLGGERTNPFDGISLNRANSAKEPLGRAEPGVPAGTPDANQQSRSSSVPRSEAKDAEIPTAPTSPFSRRKARMKTRSTARPGTGDPLGLNANANLKQKPTMNGDVPEQSQSQSQSQPQPQHFMANSAASKMPASGTDGPSMYAMPPQGEPYRLSSHSVHLANNGRLPGAVPPIGCDSGAKGSADPDTVRKMHRIPSGIGSANLTPFERQQYNVLRHLIKNHQSRRKQTKKAQGGTNLSPSSSTEFTNASFSNSFNLAMDDDAFDTPLPGPSRFNRSSVDDINTNFANDDNSAAWQFSAGSGDADSQSPSRSQSGSRARSRPTRRSPDKRAPYRRTDVSDPPLASGAQASTGFDAGGWANQFGPQTFVPQTVPNTTASPTRPSNRANPRKSRSAKPTVGNAAVVEESYSDDDGFEWLGRKGQPKFASPESPQAMDIDPPQVNLEEPGQPGAASVRNIPVEPSRPEWRSGDVGSITPEPEQASQAKQGEMGSEAQMKPTAKVMREMMGQEREGKKEKGKERERERETQIPAPILNTLGSEDTESFKLNMPELSKVAPLADLPSGLKSFADLKANLPFESKASNEIPVETSHAHPLVFPEPPKAPRAPAIVAMEGVRPSLVAWGQYLEEFESYLRLWDIFDAQVVSHFTTRKANIDRARSEKGYLFLGARGGNDVSMYRDWIEQDNDVRRRWQVACEEHEVRFKEFMAFRERMK